MMDSSIAKVHLPNSSSIRPFGELFPEFCSIMCAEVTSNGKGRKKKSTDNANRIKEESERNDSSRSDSVKTLSKG